MATELRKRSRLQMHLSTAIMLMFAVGALIWLNVRDRNVISWDDLNLPTYYIRNGVPSQDKQSEFGWPATAYIIYDWGYREAKISYDGLAIDIVVACGLLVGLWLACERWIRWRQTRKIK